jgi:hypothetical protein
MPAPPARLHLVENGAERLVGGFVDLHEGLSGMPSGGARSRPCFVRGIVVLRRLHQLRQLQRSVRRQGASLDESTNVLYVDSVEAAPRMGTAGPTDTTPSSTIPLPSAKH